MAQNQNVHYVVKWTNQKPGHLRQAEFMSGLFILYSLLFSRFNNQMEKIKPTSYKHLQTITIVYIFKWNALHGWCSTPQCCVCPLLAGLHTLVDGLITVHR